MAQYIKYYSSFEAGAPQLTQAAGALIGVLEACLVTGFNPKAVSSVTVASGVATAVCNGHGQPLDNVYKFDLDITIEGASNALVNGSKLITVVDANTFTFPAPGVPDGVVGGAITCKRTPLGWSKPFSGANKAMFARTDVQATAHMLRIEDPAGEDATAFAVESATGIDAYADRVPTAAQLASGFYWTKGFADTRAKNWAVLGDSKGFYLLVEGTGYSSVIAWRATFSIVWFGDIITRKAGDAHHCAMSGTRTAGSSSGAASVLVNPVHSWSVDPNDSGNLYLMRQHTGIVKSVGAGLLPTTGSAANPTKWYPDTVSNGGLFAKGAFVDEYLPAQGHPVRGLMPGYIQPLFRYTDVVFTETPLPVEMTDGSGEIMWHFKTNLNTTDNYHVAFSLNKPWR